MNHTIIKEYKMTFNTGVAPLVVSSPGRVNIIGEHTDYNNGFVLPAAIDKAACIAMGIREDREIHLFAKDLHEHFSMAIEDLQPVGHISWPNYMLGAIAQFIKNGFAVPGLNIVLSSEVPMGAGLSSSAAVECATVFALDHLLGTKLSRIAMVEMAQKAEHEYAGVMCGVMDQFASMMGKKDHVIKLDCQSLAYEYVPFKLEGIKILLLNTNVKHSLATSEYNTRRNECDQAVEWIKEFEPGVHSLRDASEAMLDKYVLPKSALIDRRSRFVVQEIKRLQAACDDLQRGDIKALGQKMYATHSGLSTMYNVSCPELDWLVNYVSGNNGVLGARMMGGGFGGCTINLVKEEAIEPLLQIIQPAYRQATGLELSCYITSIEDGTKVAEDQPFNN